MQEFVLNKEFITLGQLLKEVGVISTGGQAKFFLQEDLVFLNGEVENRRGKKIYVGDELKIDDQDIIKIVQ
ncbi:S4 domain-containing protein YaaA [Lactobacillus sp. YT155]|uniref:S4 domain-containing protein YaaA n=1 Tax=Lactobacillus sp. YT155 TaxID=3060955 RepID=UPI002660267D|nr:S4 domain-containing protein YaaA [Lactobacillus sp. YT155]MDO1604881.1 S4 domain-containing protein YaaA [Lactobacillus sp. YT155]